MELRDLRTFSSVVAAGGVSRASERLHLVQSAVSQAVKRLERELSVTLLVRRPGSGGVRPTEAGMALAKHAEVILNAVARAKRDMADFEDGAKGSVNLGIVPTATPLVLAALIRALRRRHPGIRLSTIEGGAPELIESLRIGELDLGVLLSPLQGEGLQVRTMRSIELVAVSSLDSDLPPQLASADLQLHPWISFPPQHPGRQWLEDLFSAVGPRPRVEVEVETVAQIKASVEAGLGLALLPVDAITPEIAAGLLRASRVSSRPECDLAYVWDRNNATRAVTTVIGELDKLAAQHSRRSSSRALGRA